MFLLMRKFERRTSWRRKGRYIYMHVVGGLDGDVIGGESSGVRDTPPREFKHVPER